MTELRSGVSKDFEQPFVVDEDSLRRIEGVLRKGEAQVPESRVEFLVYREDSRFFETLSLDDVLADPNIPRKRVSRLRIALMSKEEVQDPTRVNRRTYVSVDYNKNLNYKYIGSRVSFDVSHHDRTWALLIADELEPQIRRTLRKKKRLKLLEDISAFLWGEETRLYDGRQRVRQNLFWSVGIAFVVSLSAGGFLLAF